ncbi:hypothetical protein C5167_020807 [Papaver somniferum]|uniref:RING-type E3 ubiquitin transferase n=1 Tax=Papaver somniferum TaxID=3469 RepID=A0A4Y7IXD5_PAPSO|nr:hypothetical protein C5167_020807 [Papaver somniferum]
MGISWSGSRRRNNDFFQNPSQFFSSSDPSPLFPPPPPPQGPPPSYVFTGGNGSYPAPPSFPPPLPPPPPSYPHYYQFSSGHAHCGQLMGPVNYHQPYLVNEGNGWNGFRPVMVPQPQMTLPPPPPYLDHQMAKKIKNYVNIHKGSIKIQIDEKNLDSHLVSFTFDALVDGSFRIFYFSKEGGKCRFTPLYPEVYMPVRIPFQKGRGQKFRQPSGTGIDLGFFELDDLAKSSPSEDVFPLVIFAEASLPSDVEPEHALSSAQITQAILEKNNDEHNFQVKVIKQILWVGNARYELREIYGISNSTEVGFDDSEPGKRCVICMSEPKDTAVLPCRHMVSALISHF